MSIASKLSSTQARRVSIYDGRVALGTIKVVHADTFIAITTDGTVIGTFATLREAARTFDDGGAS